MADAQMVALLGQASMITTPDGTPCTKVCCGKYMAHRDDLTQYQPADLTAPIIPLFAKGRFPPHTDYAAIEMSCRLASLLVRSTGACKYIATMHSGDAKVINPDGTAGKSVDWAKLGADENVAYFPLPHHDQDLVRNYEEANEVLDNLANMVTFFVTPLPENVEGDTILDPDTTWQTNPMSTSQKNMFISRRAGQAGSKTYIRISQSIYDRLVNVRNGQGNCTTVAVLDLQVKLALVLVHEVSHSLERALQGERYDRVYHSTCPIAEAGYDLTKAIFGGIFQAEDYFSNAYRHDKFPHCQVSHLRGREVERNEMLFYFQHYTLREYPCGILFEHYSRTGYPMPSTKSIVKAAWDKCVFLEFSTAPLKVPTVGSIYFGFDENRGPQDLEVFTAQGTFD